MSRLKLPIICREKLEIYGDELSLSKSITLPGKNITIVCRVLNCGSNASISVSGLPPKRNFTPGDRPPTPAQSPVGQGIKGVDGDAGSPGGDAGSIFIVAGQINGAVKLAADGHVGGRAQDGGKGGPGAGT